jgi:phosphatidylglycerophosphatase C
MSHFTTATAASHGPPASAPRPGSGPCLALFDLDGTLTWHDTLMPFLRGFLARQPARLCRLWRLPGALMDYVADRDRGRLKARVIFMVLGGASRDLVDRWAEDYVRSLHARHAFRPAALARLAEHAAAGDRLVLLSASPDLYVPRIGRLLGFELCICTEIEWRSDRLAGALKTPNRRGEEKVRCVDRLRTQHPGMAIVAYGNSASDIAHLSRADRGTLVNGGSLARRHALRAGLAVGRWD